MYLEMTVENGFSDCFVRQCDSVLPTAVKSTMANSSLGRKAYFGIHSFCAILNNTLIINYFSFGGQGLFTPVFIFECACFCL